MQRHPEMMLGGAKRVSGEKGLSHQIMGDNSLRCQADEHACMEKCAGQLIAPEQILHRRHPRDGVVQMHRCETVDDRARCLPLLSPAQRIEENVQGLAVTRHLFQHLDCQRPCRCVVALP